MSAPQDPWKDILLGWCGKAWNPTRRGSFSLSWCDACEESKLTHDVGVARAADAARHQAEIATLRAQNADYVEQHGKVTRCLATRTVERDALRSTVDQQKQQIEDLRGIVRDTLWMAGRYADKRMTYAVGMYNDARVKAEAMGCADGAKVAVDGMDPEFVTLTELAEAAEATVDQQQARIAELEAALKQLIVEAEDEFCLHPTCGCSNQLALQAARQALETP